MNELLVFNALKTDIAFRYLTFVNLIGY